MMKLIEFLFYRIQLEQLMSSFNHKYWKKRQKNKTKIAVNHLI